MSFYGRYPKYIKNACKASISLYRIEESLGDNLHVDVCSVELYKIHFTLYVKAREMN